MSFHDVRLPTRYSEGSLFGPGFNTRLHQLKSGATRAVQFWPNGRRRFNLQRGIDGLDSLYLLRDFFMARGGMANTFRVLDWSDYATSPTGTTHRPGDVAVTSIDQVLVAVPGTTTQFQYVKRYVSGPTTLVRNLTMLVSGTPVLSLANVTQSSGFSVDLISGIATFTSAPVGTVKGGTQFDVHGRFGPNADAFFNMAIKALDAGELPEIEVLEELNTAQYNHARDLGGAQNHGDMGGADVQLNVAGATLNIFAPIVPSLSVILPDALELPDGGPWYICQNSGTQNFAVKDHSGATVTGASAVAPTAAVELWLGTFGGGKVWYVI